MIIIVDAQIQFESISPKRRTSFHFVSESVNANEQVVAVIQFIQTILRILFANRQVNGVERMDTCEHNIGACQYSTDST